MLVASFFSWWYSTGWSLMAKKAGQRLVNVSHMFSVPILLRTIFAPWKRVISYAEAGLSNKLRAMLDNLVSRFVGFTVRLLVLLAALILLVIVAVLSAVELVLWPLLPIGVPALIIAGVAL